MSRKKILFLCTGNSCRSQMAEGLLRHLGNNHYEVESAGTHPSNVNPLATRAMEEIGIDISSHRSKSVDEFSDVPFDIVVTVCDNAKEECPFFPNAGKLIHHSFDDPYYAEGSQEEKMKEFRRVRDEIRDWIQQEFLS